MVPMEEGQELRYVCKFCNKSFPCGRSLGGHMRSHLTNNNTNTSEKLITNRSKNCGRKPKSPERLSSQPQPEVEAGYVLRENPKKSLRFSGSDDDEQEASQLLLDKFCRECGKAFLTWKALFGHMKTHSIGHNNNNSCFEELDSMDSANHKLVLDSQSDNETPDNPIGKNNDKKKKKKKRRSQRRTRYNGTSNSSSFSVANNNNYNNNGSGVSETEQEQEEVAMCLIMLSRDVNNHWNGVSLKSVAESSDNFSGASKPHSLKPVKATFSGDSGSKKLGAEGSENCASGLGKPWPRMSRNEASINGVSKTKEIGYLGSNMLNSSSKRKASDGPEMGSDSLKRSRFECTTCNKTFHSYQALGGHRASHKKTKGCFASTTDENSENSVENDNLFKLGKLSSTERSADHEDMATGGDDVDDDDERAMESNFRVSNKKSNNTKPKGHECPICLKVFPSGQALGGHKRSHMVNGSDQAKQSKAVEIEKPVSETRDFIDLNLPAPDEEEERNGQLVASLKPWWAESSHKHKALVGLISN